MREVAKGLASLGRGDDTMLVHMTPGEVDSLQQIAMAAGGSLSINPHTGLPEAGFLKSLLPMLAGGIATLFTGPLGAALAGGATGALTGDKTQPLWMRMGLGALGGWGGAGITSALAGAGAATGTAATNAIKEAGLKKVGELGAQEGLSEAAKQTAIETAKKAGEEAMRKQLIAEGAKKATLSNIGAGLKGMFQPGGAALAGSTVQQIGLPKLYAAATPIMMAQPSGKLGQKAPVSMRSYVTRYRPGTVNPNWGQPGEPYFVGQGYDEGYYTEDNPFTSTPPPGMANPFMPAPPAGPVPGMADGGSTSNPLASYFNKVNTMKPAMLAPRPKFNVEEPSSRYGFSRYGLSALGGTPFGSLYNYGMGAGRAAGGSIGDESIGGYSDGGRLLRGPGDGVSDDIPATIHRADGGKQEARLADGEFVFPARIVSEIGNGSTEAGAQKLYAVMDKIQKDRTSTVKDVAKNTNAIRHLERLA